jgi:hypothetical protein
MMNVKPGIQIHVDKIEHVGSGGGGAAMLNHRHWLYSDRTRTMKIQITEANINHIPLFCTEVKGRDVSALSILSRLVDNS